MYHSTYECGYIVIFMPDVSQTKLVVPHPSFHEIPPSLSLFLLLSSVMLLHRTCNVYLSFKFKITFKFSQVFVCFSLNTTVSENKISLKKPVKKSIQVASSTVCFSLSFVDLVHEEYKDYTRALLGVFCQPAPSIWIDLDVCCKPDCSVQSLVFIGCDWHSLNMLHIF